jgi:hypothetical protein
MLLANAIKYKDGDRRRYDVAMVERWRWQGETSGGGHWQNVEYIMDAWVGSMHHLLLWLPPPTFL